MVQELLIVTISLFAVVDPFASIPVFLSFFDHSDGRKQRRAAVETSAAAFFLLLIFAAGGMLLLTYLNISISAFMIAGGIMLLLLAFDFLMGDDPRMRRLEKDPGDAIVPIGTPLLAGPGAITSVIFYTHLYGFGITLPAIGIVAFLSFLCLMSSMKIRGLLGKNGIKVISRIMGLITAAIAISLIEKAFITYGLLPAL